MMKFDQILHNRKSTRSFHSTPVKEKDVTAIIEAARIAPSACNSQTWRFVTVIQKEIIRKICHEAMLHIPLKSATCSGVFRPPIPE